MNDKIGINPKGYVLTIDIRCIPKNKRVIDIINEIKTNGVCLYDSTYGEKPEVVNLGGEENNWLKDVKFIDINDNSSNLDIER